jgi:hypothetical protein
VEVGRLGGDHQVRGCVFEGRGFDASGCFLLCLSSGRLTCYCTFQLGLSKPGRFPLGGHESINQAAE